MSLAACHRPIEARVDVILAHPRGQRAELVVVIADLVRRPSSGDARIDALNADLRAAACQGLAQIDVLTARAQTCAAAATGRRTTA